jgi:chemotaxis protein CheD
MYDPHLKLGGMIHFILPLSKVSPERATDKPAMFADTGMPMLLRMMYEAGATGERLLVKAAGGSRLMEQSEAFEIGRRNYEVLKKILENNNITLDNEDIGGHLTRTMRLEIDSGLTTVESLQGVREL